MSWDYKREFKFLANVVKMQRIFYYLVGGMSFSEASMNPFEFCSFACRFFIQI